MKFRSIWPAVILTALLGACSTAPTRPSRTPSPAAPSGFLQDYSLLAPDPHDPGYQRYVAPGIEFQRYRKFMVDDPVFIVNTGNAYTSVDPARLRAISDYYKSRMAAALGRHYQVADAPGPGVARLRTAVVGLVQVRAQFKVRDLIPVKAMFDAARMVAGKSPQVLRMSIEGELLDSESGKLLGETIDSRESRQTVAGASAPPSNDQIHELIDFWVSRFVARLDRANGYPADPDGHSGM